MAPRSEDTKLIIRVINFELVQTICSRYRNVTDRRTDGQMDRGRTTHDSNTALASRGNNNNNNNNNNIRSDENRPDHWPLEY